MTPDARLSAFLSAYYGKHVMRNGANPDDLFDHEDAEFLKRAAAELQRLKQIPSIEHRDFAAYQALLALRSKLGET